MRVPGLPVEEVFKRVRVGVTERSQGAQTPWESSSLTGDLVINVSVNVQVQAPPPGPVAAVPPPGPASPVPGDPKSAPAMRQPSGELASFSAEIQPDGTVATAGLSGRFTEGEFKGRWERRGSRAACVFDVSLKKQP
jgi:hypothetical protein